MSTYLDIHYSGGVICTTKPVYQYDTGRKIRIIGLNESATVAVHYAINGMTQTLNDIPVYESDTWLSVIPDILLAQQQTIHAYVYVSEEQSRQTKMHISIPMQARPKPDGYQYTNEELRGFDALLAQLREAQKEVTDLVSDVEKTASKSPYIDEATHTWIRWDADAEQYVDTGIPATGPKGNTGPQGKSFQILGSYETFEELQSAVPNPTQGDHYDVGPDQNGCYHLYMYDETKGWIDKGVMSGGGGTGDGTVKTINGVEADDEGEVALHISNVLPDEGETQEEVVYFPVKAEDSEKLGGIPATDYAKKNDLPSVPSVPTLSNSIPSNLAQTASAGSSTESSRADHVHKMPTASEVGALGKNDKAADAAKLGGKSPEYYTWTDNLLINSNFQKPYLINWSGQTEYNTGKTSGNMIDGWWGIFTTFNPSTRVLSHSTSEIYAGAFRQSVLNPSALAGKSVTLAVKHSGDLSIGLVQASGMNSGLVALRNTSGSNGITILNATIPDNCGTGSSPLLLVTMSIGIGKSVTLDWVVLIEGTYTAETLPTPIWLHPRLEMIRMGLPVNPVNLLDNSNFLNPIMQAGFNGMHGKTKYVLDRWMIHANVTANLSEDGLTFNTSGSADYKIEQNIIAYNLYGKPLTLVAYRSDGTVAVASGVMPSIDDTKGTVAWKNTNGLSLFFAYSTKSVIRVGFTEHLNTTVTLKAIALYEGTYTAVNVPPYVPKPYSMELTECQRYYENSWSGGSQGEAYELIGQAFTQQDADFAIHFNTEKHMNPSMNYFGSAGRSKPSYYITEYKDADNIANNYRLGRKGVYARLHIDELSFEPYMTYQLHAHWEACADL